MKTIKFALESVDELVITVGSAQKSHEIRNPFTAGERIQMIRRSLAEENTINMKNIIIIPVPDAEVHYLWTYSLDMLVPQYSVVFSNDTFTKLLFLERGIKVVEPQLYKRDSFSATEIRTRIAQDEEWRTLVPHGTLEIIEKIHGTDRIKAIFQKHSQAGHQSR